MDRAHTLSECGGKQKISAPLRSRTPAVQPVASHFESFIIQEVPFLVTFSIAYLIICILVPNSFRMTVCKFDESVNISSGIVMLRVLSASAPIVM
jgi:hypothetical protein